MFYLFQNDLRFDCMVVMAIKVLSLFFSLINVFVNTIELKL